LGWPCAVRSKVGGKTGKIEGVAHDRQGKAIAHTLVVLEGLAVARTDSQGRYVFLGVPAYT